MRPFPRSSAAALAAVAAGLMLTAPALSACAAVVETATAAAASGRLTLTLDLGADTGRVMIALFDSEAAYGGGDPVRQLMVEASGPRVAVFDDLPPGRYAARLFHDVNGDGRMNTNPFGLPVEPYAFSNNAVGNMGPASWDRAVVEVDGEVEQTIRLR
ncbi:MAG TPA: DUF2141 domain-containing protein [Brevundimonas sp.]|jgi:uncharacterized protein (DUF2141 family)|uniref:DUF2141 domain-containing protein n=1 Tax=Brevundimonas sp. TaxID=1871086 RepID=UPI002E166D26|nr:DUF2141 domain-containing protein [Brevundimonas sp.]